LLLFFCLLYIFRFSIFGDFDKINLNSGSNDALSSALGQIGIFKLFSVILWAQFSSNPVCQLLVSLRKSNKKRLKSLVFSSLLCSVQPAAHFVVCFLRLLIRSFHKFVICILHLCRAVTRWRSRGFERGRRTPYAKQISSLARGSQRLRRRFDCHGDSYKLQGETHTLTHTLTHTHTRNT